MSSVVAYSAIGSAEVRDATSAIRLIIAPEEPPTSKQSEISG